MQLYLKNAGVWTSCRKMQTIIGLTQHALESFQDFCPQNQQAKQISRLPQVKRVYQ